MLESRVYVIDIFPTACTVFIYVYIMSDNACSLVLKERVVRYLMQFLIIEPLTKVQ